MSDFNSTFIGNDKNPEPTPTIDFAEFSKALESRRSVRKYTTEPVPEEVIQKALAHALLAPNSSNLQTWEFYWVRSKEKRKILNEAFFSQPAATTAPELIVSVARPTFWKKHNKQMIAAIEKIDPNHRALAYYKKIVPFVYNLGPLGVFGCFKKVLFFFMGLFKVIPREMTTKGERNTWAAKSAALACENLMLSLRAQGYDSCPMEGFDSKRVKKILSLPSNAVIVMGISAGKRAPGGVFGEQLRFSKEQFIFEV